MNTLSYKTKFANNDTVDQRWLIIDAEAQVLGRLSSEVAKILRGKHKASYTPHVNCGDKVIIINADKVRLTGKKMNDKQYIRYTGYPGGQRFRSPSEVLARTPERLVEMAVRGMLPKNRLGRDIYRNLFVYAGTEHPHEAQKPEEHKLNS